MLENRETQADTYTLLVTGNQWPAGLEPTTVTLDGGASREITATVHILVNQQGNASDVLTVKATSQAEPTQFAMATLTTRVAAHYGLKLESAVLTKPGVPETQVTYTLSVNNTGNAPQTFTGHLTGNTWTSTIAPASCLVQPGSTKEFVVQVSVPAGAAGVDQDSVQVTVSSQQDSSVTADLTLTTTVAPLHRLAVTPKTDGKKAYPGQAVVYSLHLANTGNDTETFTFQLTSDWDQPGETAHVLAPDEGFDLNITIVVPAVVANGQQDVAVLSITSLDGFLPPQTVTLTTTAQYRRTYIPLARN
jgi:uncharacterized membrane protein